MNFKTFLLIVLLCLSRVSTKAQDKEFKSEFGFRSDNDAYLAQRKDRYYTNGLFISFKRATDQAKLKPGTNKKIWKAEIGQKIFNPQSGSIPDIRYVDRPFAGYLYAGASLQWLYESEHTLKTTLQAGTIGPASLAKDGQELLHKTVGFYELRGWETQINNEFGINATAEYNRFLHRSASQQTDFTLTSYANLGNTFAGAGAGILIRAGLLNQFFNSASTGSVISNNPKTDKLTQKEFFFYAVPMLNFVAYDATIQGGLFADDKGPVVFDAKPLVFSQELGAMFAQNRWTINLAAIFKTREVQSSAKAHQYGSVSVHYRFN